MATSALTEKEREVVLQLTELFWGSCSMPWTQEATFREEIEELSQKLYKEKDADKSIETIPVNS